jgi:HTH-type transcriptional regulator, sugar sensing transcriptional regulator
MKQQLRDVGLTENESKVYLALLELGPSNAGLISKKSGLHRRVVYDILDRLIKKGIIGYIIMNGVKLFQASDPERIMEILKEKEANLIEILPAMNALYKKTRESEGTNFYKGRRGFKTIFEDQLNTGKEIFIIGASPLAYEVLPFYFKWYDKRRVEKKLKVKIIFNKTEKKIKVPYSDIRYLPKKYSSDVAINIYGDKIAILLWNKESPLAVVIKNKLFVKGYKQYFDFLWSIAQKT